jgi:hypothetical protein
MRKLTIEILDIEALAEAYPETVETVTTKRVNRSLLMPIVKASRVLGREVPGVNSFYAGEKA